MMIIIKNKYTDTKNNSTYFFFERGFTMKFSPED